jgi:hypothetical protein
MKRLEEIKQRMKDTWEMSDSELADMYEDYEIEGMRDFEWAAGEIERLQKKIKQLEKEYLPDSYIKVVEQSLRALKFYADAKNWDEIDVLGSKTSKVYSDDGEMAREALKKLEWYDER